MNKPIPPIIMFIVSAFALILVFTATKEATKDSSVINKELFWIIRIVVALASSAISISIPGMIKISYNSDGTEVSTSSNKNFMSFSEKEPTIVASGAIAVFVLVYLFNPIT